MSESKSQCVNAFCSPIHNLTTFQSRHKTPPTNSDGKENKKRGKKRNLPVWIWVDCPSGCPIKQTFFIFKTICNLIVERTGAIEIVIRFLVVN